MYKMLECECSFAKRPLPQCSIWTRWSPTQLCKLQRSSCSRAGSLRQTAAQSGHFNCSHLQVACCEMFTICRFLAFIKLPPPGPNCTARPKYLRLAKQNALLCLLDLYIYTTNKSPNVKQLSWAINYVWPKLLDNKIYTEKSQFFALNL